MKKICYTAIMGKYDTLLEPVITPGWEYHCITDQPLRSDTWKITQIPAHIKDPQLQARAWKILIGYDFFKADILLWIDGNFKIIGNLDEFIKTIPDKNICVSRHPDRVCIYEEAIACIDLGKEKATVIYPQMARYLKEGYPKNNGLADTSILFRKKSLSTVHFCESWYDEVYHHSRRDQLSFNYIEWKQKADIGYFDFIPEKFFQKLSHYSEYANTHQHNKSPG